MKTITLAELIRPFSFIELRQLCKTYHVQAGRSKDVTRQRICDSSYIELVTKYNGNSQWTIELRWTINHLLIKESDRIGKLLVEKYSHPSPWMSMILQEQFPVGMGADIYNLAKERAYKLTK